MMTSDAMDREAPQSNEIAADAPSGLAASTAWAASWPALALALMLGTLLAMAIAGWLAWPTVFGAAVVASATAIAMGIAQARRDAREGARMHATLARERMANARHQLAEHLGATGTWTLERRVGEERGTRMTWSPGCFRLFSWPVEQGEPPLARFVERIHAGDRERWHLVHRRALRYGGEARIEYRFLGKGGEPVWIRSIARAERTAEGEIVRLGGVVQDITGIRSIQQRLASSEAKFRELTNLSSDWIWEADAQLRWSYLAEGAGTVLGGWTQSLPGRPLWEPPPGPRAFEQPDWDRLRSRLEVHAPVEDFEYPMIDPGGQMRFVSITGRPIFTASGQFTGYRGIGRDITQEKQQRLLLRLESDIAALVREQADPEQLVSAVLARLCGLMGWLGGVHLRRIAGIQACSAHECWGSASFLRMVEALPAALPIPANAAEGQAWGGGRSQWIVDLSAEPSLAQRLQARALGAQAISLVPITDETGKVASMLVCLSPAAVNAPRFFEQSAGIVSSTLSLFLQRKGAERRLTHRSLHDALTDLPNRIYLTHQLETRIARSEPAAVLYIDLDRYKIINDTLGHSVGDQVLIEVAQRLRDTIRGHDVAGRMGGDEFIILLSQLADRAEIERIARRVLAAIEKPFVLMDRAYFLSASIGVAIAPDDGNDAALLIKCADSAMYRVKSEGRNDIRFFTGSLSDERSDQLALAAELPLALQRGEVDLHYQPILDVAGRRVLGFEALLRWQHPTRGLLRPERFLAAAEQSNLIREIGLWALRRAIDDRLELGVQAYPDAAVSVNISARQFTEDGFLGTLNAMLNERAMPPRLLQLELTESAFIGRPERTVAVIGELRRLGVRVLIDNFGTGYASLAYLKNLPVDGLKIDQGFVRGLPEDRGNAAIVQAITTLCARLGLTAIAEGVETPEELQALRSLDCERLQGALIAEAMPFGRLAAFLATLPEVRRMHLVRDGGGQAS
jgi:diguanylate cyclase (GGDEF)-like protein/PAS domain S-box-containing protein